MYTIRQLTDTVQGGRSNDKKRRAEAGIRNCEEPLGVNNVPTDPLGSKLIDSLLAYWIYLV